MDETLEAFGERHGVHVAMSERGNKQMGGFKKLRLPHKKNWERFILKQGLDPGDVVLPFEQHTNQIYPVCKNDGGNLVKSDDGKGVDGLFTDEEGLALATKARDCVIMLGVESKNGVIFNVHAGWKGIVNGIPKGLIMNLQKCGSDPWDIHVWLGPTIDWPCYEFGWDAPKTFKAHLDCIQKNGSPLSYLVNLRGIVISQLVNRGVPRENITFSPRCTKCDPGLFSCRGGDGEDSTMAFLIWK